AKAPRSVQSIRLAYRHLDEQSTHRRRLTARDARQRVAVDRLDEPVAKHVDRRAERCYVRARRYRELLERRWDCPILDQGSARVLEEYGAIEEARPLLRHLTGAAEDGHQVALGAGRGIEDRPEAVRDG